jgi:hypothetical protein
MWVFNNLKEGIDGTSATHFDPSRRFRLARLKGEMIWVVMTRHVEHGGHVVNVTYP